MKRLLSVLCIFTLLVCSFSLPVSAEQDNSITVTPSGDKTGLTDFRNLSHALTEYDTVNLIDGATYIIGGKDKGAIDIDSNTTINAKSAVIKQINTGKGIFKTGNVNAGGYKAMVNVTINGGTYIGSTKKSGSFSLLKFFHGNNIKISGATFKNVYCGHLLEIAGCKNVVIENCYFGGKTSGTNVKNEAVQIDNCSEGCLTLPSKKSYDNTACENITFRNNTVVYPRTFGSHFTYGAGKGKFNRKIYVYNNKLTATKDTGLLVFNWYDSVIENNVISGTTVGMDIVTCFTDTVVDYRGGTSALNKNNSNPYNLTVSKNKISSKSGYALWIRGVSKRPISGITVTGNTLKTSQGRSKDRRSAIRVQFGTSKKGKGINISKNTVNNAKTEFFAYVTDSNSVKINSNNFNYTNKTSATVKFNNSKNCKAVKNKVKKSK